MTLDVVFVSSGEWGMGQVAVVVVAICRPTAHLVHGYADDSAATGRELNRLKKLNYWISKPLDFYNSKSISIIMHLFNFFQNRLINLNY